MKDFSIVLTSLRKETGLSQRQVASTLGISQALLSHYENGAREPKLDFVVKACDFYSVTADYILGRSKERKEKTPILIDTLSDVMKDLEEMKSSGDAIMEKLEKLVRY